MPTRRKSSFPWYSYRSAAADSNDVLRYGRAGADHSGMGRSVIGLCMGFGGLVGGYVPVVWGASSLSLQSFLFGALGAAAGLRLGVHVSE
jgi:hypothetical protein